MTDKLVSIPDEVVLSKIYMIRNQKVMLDSDLKRASEDFCVTGQTMKTVNVTKEIEDKLVVKVMG